MDAPTGLRRLGEAAPAARRVFWVLFKVFKYALIALLCYQLLYPILYMISMSIRPPEQVLDPSVVWIPKSFSAKSFKDALNVMDYGKSLLNTIKLAGVTAILQCAVAAFVGYGFARFRFRGRGLLFGMVSFTLLVPSQTILVPLYVNMRFFLQNVPGVSQLLKLLTGQNYINLIGSYFSIFLPSLFGVGLKGGLFIFIFRQFFRGFPKELEEAALIDGCGPYRTFATIMLPNATNIIITVLLFSLVWNWNDYFTANTFLGSTGVLSVQLSMLKENLSLVMQNLQTISNPFAIATRMQAGCLLMSAPLLLIYVVLQRFFMDSIERSGIVG